MSVRKKNFISKYQVIFTLVFSCCASQLYAEKTVVPDINNPVVGLVGASFVDPEASPDNTVGLTSLNGSSYRGLADFFIAKTINDKHGIVYREKAEGGGTSDGANGFKTALEQAQELVEHTTMWADGTHMKAAVIFQFNDCLHNIAGLCPTEADVINNSVINILDAIYYLQANDVKVFVVEAINWEDADFPLAEQIFASIFPGFQWATQEQYSLFQSVYEEHVYNLEGVTSIYPWDGFGHIGDGLHPDHKTKKRVAEKVHAIVKKALKK